MRRIRLHCCQLALAEFIGAPIMVAILVILFRAFLAPELLNEAREQAERRIAGRMEGHADIDMAVSEGGSLWQRITSDEGLTAISHYFVMDWASVWLDVVGGLLIAGALAAWVPLSHQISPVFVPRDRAARSSRQHPTGSQDDGIHKC